MSTEKRYQVMPVVRLDEAEMEFFHNRSPQDPSVVADEQIRSYAERVGGATLEFWRLAMGRVWGEPYMMTVEEVAGRLNRPVTDLEKIIDETNVACGWREDKGKSSSAIL